MTYCHAIDLVNFYGICLDVNFLLLHNLNVHQVTQRSFIFLGFLIQLAQRSLQSFQLVVQSILNFVTSQLDPGTSCTVTCEKVYKLELIKIDATASLQTLIAYLDESSRVVEPEFYRISPCRVFADSVVLRGYDSWCRCVCFPNSSLRAFVRLYAWRRLHLYDPSDFAYLHRPVSTKGLRKPLTVQLNSIPEHCFPNSYR